MADNLGGAKMREMYRKKTRSIRFTYTGGVTDSPWDAGVEHHTEGEGDGLLCWLLLFSH